MRRENNTSVIVVGAHTFQIRRDSVDGGVKVPGGCGAGAPDVLHQQLVEEDVGLPRAVGDGDGEGGWRGGRRGMMERACPWVGASVGECRGMRMGDCKGVCV